MKLPVLFIGHGSPMNAVEETPYVREWRQLGSSLRSRYGNEIKAVLAVSAHWVGEGSAVTVAAQPQTIHDFYGFPQALFDVRYPAPGSPELAQEVRRLLGKTRVAEDTEWGLDHGAWSVLCHLFPEADVPVVQLRLDARLGFAEHFELGRKLAELRSRGVLIVASGSIIHNLRLLDRNAPDDAGAGYEWAEQVRLWVNRLIAAGDTQTLRNERAYPPEFRLAAPTPEHYWPLLYAAGAAEGDEARIFNDEILGKSLSMTSAVWGMAV
ncbi:4,5-DOPA dioxygenase extradiol [Bergeriella denitrificans]|uniref:Extradiol ring-cleavage dioxygenase, class III enzyme, subunit n=1 Tax=Bergeriella denitrificans TaxID=494 RepID=A0A378UE96_BERDE|nr:4,5-DOPA dioxygenase extradiol [Bergeriella denitrificans]STZ75724.1 extradiol ring-cleavage dioxygenase, class III enzyme, subunit [Bergeriella denitrificans]